MKSAQTNGLFIFARFHASAGREEAAGAALREQVAISRTEPGCVSIEVFRSTRDPRLFFLHARWTDDGAFEVHAELPNTSRFLERMQALIDHPLDVSRTRPLG